MGEGISYCDSCRASILEVDFETGSAVILLGKRYCTRCKGDAIKKVSLDELTAGTAAGKPPHPVPPPRTSRTCPFTGTVIPGLTACRGTIRLRSSYPFGKKKRASCGVRIPRAASFSARRGPTPLTYWMEGGAGTLTARSRRSLPDPGPAGPVPRGIPAGSGRRGLPHSGG